MSGVTPRFELGINAVLHVLILYSALTFLFLFVVSKTETRALQGEFDNALTTNLKKALAVANERSGGELKNGMAAVLPSLRVIEKTVSGPSKATEAYNNGIFMGAYLVIGIFIAVLVTMLMVMAYGANKRVRKSFMYVMLGNIVLFAVVGLVEYTFFKMVATKFIPVKPSLITKSIIDDIKTEFK